MRPDSAIAVRESGGGALATGAPSNPWSGLGLLKPHAGGVVAEAPRVDALATISAGFKQVGQNGRSFPVVSRDGKIHLHDPGGRAPGLAAALEERKYRSLTIALASDRPGEVMQQRFAAYTATRLVAYGQGDVMTVIHVKDGPPGRDGKPSIVAEREVVRRGENPERFQKIVEKCSVQTSVYFTLARWLDDGRPELYMPDGLGLYRLRFTSLNSAEAIKGQLAFVAGLTGGRIAGVPLELALDYREVAGPDGSRRNVPVWTLVLRPPTTLKIQSALQVRQVLVEGIEQASALALPVPRDETYDVAAYEGPDVDLDHAEVIDGDIVGPVSERDVRRLAGGGPCNRDSLLSNFFTGARGTSLATDDGRREFMLAFTGGMTGSLAEFASMASRHDADRLLKALAERVKVEIEARQADRLSAAPQAPTAARQASTYARLFPADDDDQPQQGGAASHSNATPKPEAPSESDGDIDGQLEAATRKHGGRGQTAPSPLAEAEAMGRVEAAARLTGAAPGAAEPPRPAEGAKLTATQWRAVYAAWSAEMRRLDTTYRADDPATISAGKIEAATRALIASVDDMREYIDGLDAMAGMDGPPDAIDEDDDDRDGVELLGAGASGHPDDDDDEDGKASGAPSGFAF